MSVMKASFASLMSAYKSAAPTSTQASSSSSSFISTTTKQNAPLYSKQWHDTVEFLENYEESSSGNDNDNRFASDHKTIALLFIIQKELPNEVLWRLWMERLESSNHHIKVWIHAKDTSTLQSRWIKDRLVRKFQLRPNWASLELTKTMVCLMFEAMVDCPNIDYFVFASESCMPFKSANETFSTLFPTNSALSPSCLGCSSFIKYRETPNNGFSRIQQFDVLKGRFPEEHILKGDQWVGITYKHARKLFQLLWFLQQKQVERQAARYSKAHAQPEASGPLADEEESSNQPDEKSNNISAVTKKNTNTEEYLQKLLFEDILRSPFFTLFQGLKASDEMFFPTVLSMLRCRTNVENTLSSSATSNSTTSNSGDIVKKRWTYAEWEGQASSPVSFNPAELLKNLPNIFSSSAAVRISSTSSTASHTNTDSNPSPLFVLPQTKYLHPNLCRAMDEGCIFFRKIIWSDLSYYRKLPTKLTTIPADLSQRNQHQGRNDNDESNEIQDLLSHGPVAQMLDLVQKWWLLVHRQEHALIIQHGRLLPAAKIRISDQNTSANDGCSNSNSMSRTTSTAESANMVACTETEALLHYWEEYCMPIVVNVLYYNRSYDRYHSSLEDNSQLRQNMDTSIVTDITTVDDTADANAGTNKDTNTTTVHDTMEQKSVDTIVAGSKRGRASLLPTVVVDETNMDVTSGTHNQQVAEEEASDESKSEENEPDSKKVRST